MEEFKGFIPVIIGLFVVFVVIVAIASSVQWVFSNPLALITLLVVLGGIIYLLRKRSRARTRV